MKELSRNTVLALAALHLMVRSAKPQSVAEIGKTAHADPKQVRKVLRKLLAGGLIRGRPGQGYRLDKAPGSIRALDVVRIVDSAKAPKAPCGGDYDACDSRATCILAPLCRSAEEAFLESLRNFTLADLADARVDLPNCMDPGLRTLAS